MTLLKTELIDVNLKINQLKKDKPNMKQAIIVAGSTLSTIKSDPDLEEIFLSGAVQVDVVLACRVSPA